MIDFSSRYRVALLAGGDSPEREVSLRSGLRVAAALDAAGHEVQLFDPAVVPLETVPWSQVDVAFLSLHGGAGEDGRVQQWLAARHIPFTGSGPDASRLAMSKSRAKRRFLAAGLLTPPYRAIAADAPLAMARAAADLLGFPVIVKPEAQGSSLGVGLARAAGELAPCWEAARRYDRCILLERYICGREMTVVVLGRRPLPLLEITGQDSLFDFRAKYDSDHIAYRFETALGPKKDEELRSTAVTAAAALGTSGLIRVDLMIDAKQRPWVLEVNTLPGMTDHSLAPCAAAEAGIDLSQLCDWMLRDALERQPDAKPLQVPVYS